MFPLCMPTLKPYKDDPDTTRVDIDRGQMTTWLFLNLGHCCDHLQDNLVPLEVFL